ncbi:hypothetical protein [Actinomadura sp. BRA 177]|uniref:hypothetical protein n=1 Tax=Actinomadura sp. BRA 177 TaxID=2745202 RepID=UPI001594E9CC|nr:hypothetical protein [Actinomadura sp. BRA 177]NVI92794.1 hypothetical protein [Actinomadura sp. BRA 177]
MIRPYRRRALAAAVVFATAFAVSPPASGAPGADRPGLSAQPGQAAVGTTVRVRGSAWTPGAVVQVQICGQKAVHGSADCDTRGGVTARIAPTGTFEAGLTVGAPPAACPCVLRAATLPGAGGGPPRQAAIPFAVPGHPTGAILPEIVPVQADIVGLELVGGGGRGELFGGSPRRVLVLRVRNSGADPIKDAPLVVGWGADKEPDNPLDAPRTGVIAPGETAVYRIAVKLPPASFGTFAVGGRFAGSVPFKTSFSTFPWGLIGVNVLAALLLLLGIRLTLRRRAARKAASRARGAIAAAGADAPAHHRMAPRSRQAVEVGEMLAHLDRAALTHGDPDRVDRAELISYLRSRGEAPVDLQALDRFLGERR